jgi:hypothetical protein
LKQDCCFFLKQVFFIHGSILKNGVPNMSGSRIGVTNTGPTAQVQAPKNLLEKIDAASSKAVGASLRAGNRLGGAPSTAAGRDKKLSMESQQIAQGFNTGGSGRAQAGLISKNAKGSKPAMSIKRANLSELGGGGAQKLSQSANEGKKIKARSNNEGAYFKGANPFERADQTRAKSGQYLNHGDRVADIAADVRQWQTQIEGAAAKPVRSNADAARVLESVIARSKPTIISGPVVKEILAGRQDSRDLSPREREQLTNTLLKLESQGQYFGSHMIEAAAREAKHEFGSDKRFQANAPSTKSIPATASEAQFTRDVFNGKFRKDVGRP